MSRSFQKILDSAGALQQQVAAAGSTRDQYLSSIEQYKGSSIYDMLLANPYVLGREDFVPNFWQRLQEDLFQDFSARHNWEQQNQIQSDEYVAKILSEQNARNYNSIGSEVQREKASGINPDLTGVQDAGTAAAVPEDPNTVANPVPTLGDILGSAQGAYNIASSLVSGIGEFGMMCMQFRSAGLDNDIKELGMLENATRIITEADEGSQTVTLPNIGAAAEKAGYKVLDDGTVLGPDGKPVTGEGYIDENNPDVLDHVLDSINAAVATPKSKSKEGLIAANKLFKSPRLRRFAQAVRDNYPKNSAKRTEMREQNRRNIAEAHKATAEAQGDTFWDPDPVKYAENVATYTENIDKKIRSVELDIKKAMKRSATAEADYAEDFYSKDEHGNVIVAVSDRNARVAQNALQTAVSKVDTIVDEEVDKWSQDLKEKHTWWATGLRLFLPQIRNGLKENYVRDLMQKFNFGRSEVSETSTSGGVTTTTKQIK